MARGLARGPGAPGRREAIGDQYDDHHRGWQAVRPRRAVPVTTDAPLMQPSRPGSGTDGTSVLDREFRAATLSALRDAVLRCASAAGLSRDRSIDVMLAAHELAANVIRHGSGLGRL